MAGPKQEASGIVAIVVGVVIHLSQRHKATLPACENEHQNCTWMEATCDGLLAN